MLLARNFDTPVGWVEGYIKYRTLSDKPLTIPGEPEYTEKRLKPNAYTPVGWVEGYIKYHALSDKPLTIPGDREYIQKRLKPNAYTKTSGEDHRHNRRNPS